MDIKRSRESWDAGFRAGYYNEVPGNDYGFEKILFACGFAEGKAKREGKLSLYYVDQGGQVQFSGKGRVETISTRYYSEVIL